MEKSGSKIVFIYNLRVKIDYCAVNQLSSFFFLVPHNLKYSVEAKSDFQYFVLFVCSNFPRFK